MVSPLSKHGTRDAIASGLAFAAREIAGLWSLQGNRSTPLSRVVNELFAVNAQVGDMLRSAELRLFALSPQQGLLLSETAQLPLQASGFAALLTDQSHGYCQFQLGGAQAFAFVASYVSADIAAWRLHAACLRCRLGQYTVLLWWDDSHDIHFLLERSYAESFADYLGALMARWRPQAL